MIIDGKAIAQKVREEIKEETVRLNFKPGLAVVRVGDDPASAIYVNSKEKTCNEVGFLSRKIILPEETMEDELLALVDELNGDPDIHGILVQLPLPGHIDEEAVLKRIYPDKDVDGFHPESVGKLWTNSTGFVPATPKGILRLLQETLGDLEGKNAVIIGRSNIVGKPIAGLLLSKSATVTICHSRTRNLADHTRRADILISAVGKPNFITSDMVKPGVCVIDVGINRVPDETRPKGYRVVGDVDFEKVKDIASFITPVPGGVGPMTIAMLLENTLMAAKRSYKS